MAAWEHCLLSRRYLVLCSSITALQSRICLPGSVFLLFCLYAVLHAGVHEPQADVRRKFHGALRHGY